MKLYLSSYKLGNNPERLVALFSLNKNVGYIPNALDFTKADPARKSAHIEQDMESLRSLGLIPILLDLKDYFDQTELLQTKLSELGGLFISGGNVFILRQAMKLSGLDNLLIHEQVSNDFVYAGYSAAGCVLSPSLHGYEITDDPEDFPYEKQKETIWDGLGLIEFAFLPHFDSDHPESESVAKEIIRCEKEGIPYKALSDGEVLILES